MKKPLIEQFGRNKRPLKEGFDTIYDKFNSKDYWGVKDRIKTQLGNWKRAMAAGDEGAKKYTEKDIVKLMMDRNYEETRAMYEALRKMIKKNDIDGLKRRIRHDQPVSKAFFTDITGKQLGKTTKEIHQDLEDFFGMQENVIKESSSSKPKFKKGQMVNYIPKLSGFNPKTKLEIINAVYKNGDDLTSAGWYYTFKNSSLSANEKNIKLAESKETIKEATGGSADEFAKKIEDMMKKYFPNSTCGAQYQRGMGSNEMISITFLIGQKSDWDNKISGNAPVKYGALVFGLKDKKTTENMELRTTNFPHVITQPENNMFAYSTIKVANRQVKGGEDRIFKSIEATMAGLKKATKDNLGKMTSQHQWVKKYI